jgi:DNA-binding IclR family transcriptional regulator
METRSEVRVLGLFEAFAASGRAMTLSELAESLKIPQSSCFNLLKGVERCGYLYAAKARGAIYPTRKLFDVAQTIFAHDAVTPEMRARMASLRNECGETVCLAKRRDAEVVYLEVIESAQSIRFSVHVGETRPLHANSMGKAILAQLPAAERRKVLGTLDYTALSKSTLASADALEADIERGKQRGWFSNFGETVPEAIAAALPVRIAGEWYGASIVGPASRMQDRLGQHVDALQRAVADITEASHAAH